MTITLQAWGGSPSISSELESIAAKVTESVVLVHGSRYGVGSGVVWSEDGLIISNHHVVPGEEARVRFNNGTTVEVKATARDSRRDLVALTPKSPIKAKAATLGDSTSLKAGQLVIAVGNPQGERNAVTLGILSSVNEKSDEPLRLSLTLRPGNSGGALADLSGRVVGIPNMVMRNGLSLAVPGAAVERLLRGEQGGKLGIAIRGIPFSKEQQERYSLSGEAGLVLLGVEPDGAAYKAGLMVGDIVVGVESQGASLGIEAIAQRELPKGKPAKLQVLRSGSLRTIEVTPL